MSIPSASEDVVLDYASANWSEQVGKIEQLVTHLGRVSDLIILSRFPWCNVTAGRCFRSAVFATGRPTLLVAEGQAEHILDHVFIAWNGSLEASRAVFASLPLLQAAQRVSIFSRVADEREKRSIMDLIAVLSRYGISAERVVENGGSSTTEVALLASASHARASLIVMGAYTHSRLWEEVLGGVTQHMLQHATVPTLMCH